MTAPMAWVARVEEAMLSRLADESSGHDSAHAFRVRDLAVRLAGAIQADSEVVEAAALLHDVGHRAGRADHAERGAAEAADVLRRSGFPDGKIGAVFTCI